MAVLVV